ncbi:hypothetical protein WN48_05897 [Eufriesea mexicana]|uniref:Uncharacterized protein n=1 Tax=Eufriesea mexicana TaxID=516756 RepID=A0A310SFT6_9HYME|nr:hypothetical protein WN48_05897 [Eufriesea mexicana]
MLQIKYEMEEKAWSASASPLGHVGAIDHGNGASKTCFQTNDFLEISASSPEPRTCPYLGKFTVTGVNRNQRNIRESRRNQHQEGVRRDREKVRHAQERTQEDRRGRKLDFDAEKRRANNEYLVHERMGRRARSNRNNRNHRDHSLEEASSKRTLDIEDLLRDRSRSIESASRSKVRRTHEPAKRSVNMAQRASNRSRRSPKMEDFRVDADDFTRIRQFWTSDFDDPDGSSILEVQEDYFGDYPDSADLPKKRSGRDERETTSSLVVARTKRNVEELDPDDGSLERREKREEDISRCSSEVTTITIGCSTADRMEFQTDCVEDNAIAYSCHGRWFDAEGTQFVIATQLAPGTSWSSENNRPQPYRNSRRLCFMYKESGGVVSLTASEVACQRGIPPPPPMLAFNATSTGEYLLLSFSHFTLEDPYGLGCRAEDASPLQRT